MVTPSFLVSKVNSFSVHTFSEKICVSMSLARFAFIKSNDIPESVSNWRCYTFTALKFRCIDRFTLEITFFFFFFWFSVYLIFERKRQFSLRNCCHFNVQFNKYITVFELNRQTNDNNSMTDIYATPQKAMLLNRNNAHFFFILFIFFFVVRSLQVPKVKAAVNGETNYIELFMSN